MIEDRMYSVDVFCVPRGTTEVMWYGSAVRSGDRRELEDEALVVALILTTCETDVLLEDKSGMELRKAGKAEPECASHVTKFTKSERYS